MYGRKIYRKDAADIFYSERKLKKFYKGKVPSSLTLGSVGSRLELVTKKGSRRIVQGRYMYR